MHSTASLLPLAILNTSIYFSGNTSNFFFNRKHKSQRFNVLRNLTNSLYSAACLPPLAICKSFSHFFFKKANNLFCLKKQVLKNVLRKLTISTDFYSKLGTFSRSWKSSRFFQQPTFFSEKLTLSERLEKTANFRSILQQSCYFEPFQNKITFFRTIHVFSIAAKVLNVVREINVSAGLPPLAIFNRVQLFSQETSFFLNEALFHWTF